jgi:hypothetical protein
LTSSIDSVKALSNPRNLRVTLFFYTAYIVVNYVYIVLLRPEVLNYNLVFIISPLTS